MNEISELDEFLTFIFSNINDRRITFYKKMKYGYRYYYITMTLRQEDKNGIGGFRDNKNLQIIIDNRNKCIEIGSWEDLIIFEDETIVNKWSVILEDHYKSGLSEHLKHCINTFLDSTDTVDKDFGRNWKMRGMFEDDQEEKSDE